jgi:hypothetical protein
MPSSKSSKPATKKGAGKKPEAGKVLVFSLVASFGCAAVMGFSGVIKSTWSSTVSAAVPEPPSVWKAQPDKSLPRLPKLTAPLRFDVPCSKQYRKAGEKFVAGCHPSGELGSCARVVIDDFITEDEVQRLRSTVEKGIASRRDDGGPTIMDINSGFIKDGQGLVNLYKPGGRPSPPTSVFAAVLTRCATRAIPHPPILNLNINFNLNQA